MPVSVWSRCERVTRQGDVDAVPQRSRRQKTEGLLAPHLPVAAVDENQKRRIHGTACKVIDPLAFAHAVPQVETFRTAFGQKAAAFVEPGEQPALSATAPVLS